MIMLIAIPSTAFSDADFAISEDIIEKAKNIPISKTELKEFKDPIQIFMIEGKEKSKEIDKLFEEGIKVSSDRTAVSVRDFSNVIGAEIYWDNENRLVYVRKDNTEVVLPIDKKVIFVNGEIFEIDVPATIDEKIGRTFLPLRTLAESLGYQVDYIENAHAINISSPEYQSKGFNENAYNELKNKLDPANEKLENWDDNSELSRKIDSIINEKDHLEVKTSKRKVDTKFGEYEENYADEISDDLLSLINDTRILNNKPGFTLDRQLAENSDVRSSEYKTLIKAKEQIKDLNFGTQYTFTGQYVVGPIYKNNPSDIYDRFKNSTMFKENIILNEGTSVGISTLLDDDYLYINILVK